MQAESLHQPQLGLNKLSKYQLGLIKQSFILMLTGFHQAELLYQHQLGLIMDSLYINAN